MKYVSSFVISWLWPEVVRSWRRDVLWIRRHHLCQLRRRRVGRKTEFWWRSGERHGKAANLHEVEVPVRKTFFFFNKMAEPYLLSGMFLFFFRSRFRRWKKESIFTKEGVFGCDVFNLRFWKLRRSTLLWKVVFCGSGDTAFSQKKFDLPAVGKSRWIFSQWLRKTSRFFFIIFKGRSTFSNGKRKHSV